MIPEEGITIPLMPEDMQHLLRRNSCVCKQALLENYYDDIFETNNKKSVIFWHSLGQKIFFSFINGKNSSVFQKRI